MKNKTNNIVRKSMKEKRGNTEVDVTLIDPGDYVHLYVVSWKYIAILYSFASRYRLDIVSVVIRGHCQSSFAWNAYTHIHTSFHFGSGRRDPRLGTARSLFPAVDVVIVSLCYKRIACA